MMTSKNLILALVSTFGCLFATATPALAGDCSPDLEATYDSGHGTSVKVVAFEWRLDGNNMPWHREGVSNKVITKNKSETFKSQKLGGVAKGQKIEVRAIFKPDTGSGYGSEQASAQTSAMKACENNKTYGVTIK